MRPRIQAKTLWLGESQPLSRNGTSPSAISAARLSPKTSPTAATVWRSSMASA